LRILYFAPIDWNFIRQRPQHIAERLSRFFEFIYIQPLGLRNLRLKDFGRICNRFWGLFYTKKSCSNLNIKSLFFIPVLNRYIEKLNKFIITSQLKRLADDETIVWITAPNDIIPELLRHLKFKVLVYEIMDDYPKIHPSRSKKIIQVENRLIKDANLVITTSSILLEKAPREKTILVGNGVDYTFFNKSSFEKPAPLQGMKKIIGYIGTIDYWLDFDTIDFAAEQRKDLDFVFVGPVRTNDLPDRPNIHFLGTKYYSTIPDFVHFFDVCIIPFKRNQFADTINPVKIYEYFALGKPVVASKTQEISNFMDLLYMTENKHDFLSQLENALSEQVSRIQQERKAVAESNDWSLKAKSIQKALLRLVE
jgi:teichuronic acid biosynthesis glycosyltransferase TuaH